ncbi:threonyl-tRNA synthetase [Paenibacillus phyllosphaerae]|uniref:Threonine--tRNA ligase n=1 Tax=Paenibacillus phyllosphaerae TaxID=274593 RepID=A0A7W5FQM2_9BACL|nr:threonine--tRNA ligase [Paenibacillus phyllosphaerae]MBB3113382.1 threonyl-tRNA synthetase [Paenibacillus phyllosphaerae]
MEQIHVTMPDGTSRRFNQTTTLAQVAESIGKGLAKQAIAGKINGTRMDLNQTIAPDSHVEIITLESPEGLEILRHSTAHVLAQALKRLYGEQAVKLAIGPVIEGGYYYDVEMNRPLSSDDLVGIEREMQRIVQENLSFSRHVISREDARSLFTERVETYKVELLHALPEDSVITLYSQGEFTDLCRGPHLPSTGWIKAFKLLSVAGAYWRGNSSNKMLQRIYGTAFAKKPALDEHLHMLEEARKRDHRKIAKELELFMFSEEAPGMPFYLPNGMIIRTELEDFARKVQRKLEYKEVRTPLMMNNRIWEQSGHWDHYKDNMYFTNVDDTTYALKPMNCPGHMLIYKDRRHSYRELPIRLSEFGQVHRHEFSGALGGMTRVRTFCQDDAHLFVLPDQIEEEISRVIDLIDYIYSIFGFSYEIELSTRPEDSMGSDELWTQAEESLRSVLTKRGVSYRLNEGDGAFYGPKIDFHIQDALKRSWQCGTIQLDFQMPEKFDLSYIGEDNGKHRPVVIHRAVYGSIDRFIGILTEHYAGAFPLWLAPVQVRILPVSERYVEYAYNVKQALAEAGIRIEVDSRNEKLGYKIREAQLQKTPYMAIVGENEMNTSKLSVRKRGTDVSDSMNVTVFIESLMEELADKR